MLSKSEKLVFRGALGQQLRGRLDLPGATPRAYALFGHCFSFWKDGLPAAQISRALAAHGVAVLRFDFTGLGSSAGGSKNEGFASSTADLVAAAEHLRANFNGARAPDRSKPRGCRGDRRGLTDIGGTRGRGQRRPEPSGRRREAAHVLASRARSSRTRGDRGTRVYQLLLASLGACAAMTLRMYSGRKQLPLEHVRVELERHEQHARDCAECETTAGLVDRIERVIELSGALSDAARARLLEIADKCPVHHTLHSEVVLRTRLSQNPAVV